MNIKEDNNVKRKVMELRDYKVVKANDLIQKSRFNLKVQEQKILLYLISKIKPDDIELKEHTFKIQDFCVVCGLDYDNGANYNYIKQTLKSLRDKSIWVTLENGSETTLAWLDYVTIEKNNGTVKIKIYDRMKPYLLHLKERYTQYEILYILAMKSKYSLRLYEILKSYEYQHKKVFDIEEFKKLLSAENYILFADFKRFVLDIAMREINDLSDINVTYEIIKERQKFAKIEFTIKLKKDITERIATLVKIEEIIGSK